MEQTPNKSQDTKLTLEKKILPPLLLGLELATFRSPVQRSNQQAIPAEEKISIPQAKIFQDVLSGYKDCFISNIFGKRAEAENN